MKTQTQKLAFNKSSLVELNEAELLTIDGGSSPVYAVAVASSAGCAALGGAVLGGIAAAIWA